MRARDCLWFRHFVFVAATLALNGCTTPEKTALKEYAPQSPDADIEAVSLSASDNDTFDPERVGTTFPDTTRQVAIWYRWNEADAGKKVGIHWSKDGAVVLEQADTLVKPSGASVFVLKMSAGSPLPIGNYQVELLEDGVAVTTIPFKVGDAGSAETAVAPTEDAPTGEPSAGQEETVATADSAAEAASEPQPSSAPARMDGGVLASHETEWPGVVVELTELVRKGNALSAKLRFTNNGTRKVKPDFYYRDTYVLDENNKKYEVLKDDKGGYLGSVSSGYNYWWGETIEPGVSRTAWMRFQAPPAEVKTLTVQVGTMEPFEDVEIQD